MTVAARQIMRGSIMRIRYKFSIDRLIPVGYAVAALNLLTFGFPASSGGQGVVISAKIKFMMKTRRTENENSFCRS
jgi:hypothetical protein